MANLADGKDPFYAKLTRWTELKAKAAELKDQEMALRKELCAEVFPTPKEGANTVELLGGWKFTATHKLNRKLDEAALPAVVPKLRELIAGKVDQLFKYTPEMSVKEYKSLLELAYPAVDGALGDEKLVEAVGLIHQILTTTPGSPEVKVVPPKA